MPGGLSDVRSILVSDLHLQASAPVARSGEPCWFAAMARPLAQLRELAAVHGCPILYAGDIFDRWNASAEVINFALEHLPPGWAVPGQHDLANHNYGEIKRTAYWTLCEAGVLVNLEPGVPTETSGGVVAHGFPWGHPPEPITKGRHPEHRFDVAVIHRFIYTKGKGYTGAPEDRKASAAVGTLAGFDAAAYGDNHKGFITKVGGVPVCNCGGFMRRKVDERAARPGVGLLMGDGTIERHRFDLAGEHFAEASEAEEAVGKLLDMSAFVEGLEGLGDGELEFVAALRQFLRDNKTEKEVAALVLAAAATE